MSNNVQICTCHTVSQADCPFHGSYATFNHPTDMVNIPTPETDNCARVYQAAGMPAAHRVLSDLCQKLELERDKWKAAHDNQVNLKRMLMNRPDLKERSVMIEKLIAERDKAKELLSHFITHYEALDYSEATLDELEKIAVDLWSVVKERDQLRKVVDELANIIYFHSLRPQNALDGYNQLPHIQERKTK